MKFPKRALWAFGIVLVDLLVVVVPIFAMAAAYILIVRPVWFRTWIQGVYAE